MTSHEHAYRRLSPEIVKSICRALLEHGPHHSKTSAGYKAVANLSATCKHLREPALDVFWHTIPDVAGLFLVLPASLYTRRKLRLQRATATAEYVCFQGDVNEDQLSTFFANARRVKVINAKESCAMPKFSGHYAAPSVYEVLAALLRGRPLCPNIKALRYGRDETIPLSIFRSFHILMGPQLQEVHIYSHTAPLPNRPYERDVADDEHAASLLATLKERAPGLRKVHITLAPSRDLVRAAVGPFVCALTNENLVSVQMVRELPLDPEAFCHLGKLPRLRTLNVDVNHPAWTTYTTTSDPHNDARPLFPSLRRLQINGVTLIAPTKLLSFIGSPVLRELTINASSDVPRHELYPLFAAIAALPAGRTSLTTLCVQVGSVTRGDQVVADAGPAARAGWAYADNIPDPVGEKTLEPLLAMPRLEDIMLHIPCPFDFTDRLLHKLAAAWPDINRLILGSACLMLEFLKHKESDGVDTTNSKSTAKDAENPAPTGGEGQRAAPKPCRWRKPRASLLALHAFAELCPKLSVLALEVDADLTPLPRRLREPRPNPRVPPRGHPLDSLHVGLSPIDNPLAVAALLSDWFPWLQEITSSWDAIDEGPGADWDEEEDEDEEGGILEPEGWSDARAHRIRWDRARDLIPKFAAVRRQERRWRAKEVPVAAGLGPAPAPTLDEEPMDLHDDHLRDLDSDDSIMAF